MASTVEGIPAGPPRQGSQPIPWRPMAWFSALLLICYAPVLVRLVSQWANDEDMGHGFFVPLVAAYICWQSRQELLAEPPSPSWWGLLVVAYGAVQLFIATLGAELFLARTAFIISLVGTVLLLEGLRRLRILAFPLFLLCFMVPIPAIIYSQITFPMQLFASQVASATLSVLGIPVLREGNILELASQRLNVVEACSGIRSLLSLSFLSLVYAYFFDKKVWMRGVLLIATLPIAIIANASRVTLTGLVSEYDAEMARGVFHFASGWVIFMVALVIIVAFHQFVNLFYRRLHARR
ncbi:MAG: exosortase/archaeosortase family protein [Acidobacteriales bacterium]|nr:MAG: exosortase/archaeosortase family protein [Terriglobales bacterium]